jgi:hypothetical protein
VAAEAQIRDLEQRVRQAVVDQQVLGLEVAVHHAVPVHVGHALE